MFISPKGQNVSYLKGICSISCLLEKVKNYIKKCISTGCASFIKNISALTAYELCKVPLPYCLKDTNHLLRKIHDLNCSNVLKNKDIIHVTFDVAAMFPSISKSFGLEQCKIHLDQRENKLFSTQCILDALEITLDNNLTEFNGQMYRQIKGTAMGPKNACAYADTAMTKIDKLVNEGGWDPKFKPLLWERFRDDIYILWTHGLEKLLEFRDWLNSQIQGLVFIMSIPSPTGSEFLELFIYTKDGILHTKVYSKPCDDHTFLVPSSCHPTHTLNNIPKSTAHRIYRLTSEKREYEKSKLEYSTYLKERGYNPDKIEEEFTKIESKNRLDLIGYNQINNETQSDKGRLFPLVTPFNPSFPNVSAIINKHKHIFDLDSELKTIIKPENIFASFQGNPTILDILVHSKLPQHTNDTDHQSTPLESAPQSEPSSSSQSAAESSSEPSSEPSSSSLLPYQPDLLTSPSGECKPCDKGCNLCKNFLVSTKTFSSYHTNEIFSINETVDCNTDNVVYLINDKICKISNVGCTTNATNVRFRNHKSHIKHNRYTCEISKHFSENSAIHNLDKSNCKLYDNSLKEHIEIIIIEKVKLSKPDLDVYERLHECEIREDYWKNKLRTWNIYGGLNTR